MHLFMNVYVQNQIDLELRSFTTAHFVKPCECRNLDQARFYARELCARLEELEKRFDYVPHWAYALLAQYNTVQHTMLHANAGKPVQH
jgi:hypothetical protein